MNVKMANALESEVRSPGNIENFLNTMQYKNPTMQRFVRAGGGRDLIASIDHSDHPRNLQYVFF
jgi:hypothetical protein